LKSFGTNQLSLAEPNFLRPAERI